MAYQSPNSGTTYGIKFSDMDPEVSVGDSIERAKAVSILHTSVYTEPRIYTNLIRYEAMVDDICW